MELEIASYELSIPKPALTVISPKAPEFVQRLEQWRTKHGLIESAELVESAAVLGDESEAIGAARILVAARSKVPELVRRNAALLLDRAGLGHELDSKVSTQNSTETSIWRTYLRSHPRNPLAWSELARIQLAEGFANQSAERSMSIALALAPSNRHVLRSAARLYVHLDQADRAYALVKRNEATPHDAWLLAAEVALAGTIDKPPAHYKLALSALDAQLQPRQITELASALGTHFLRDGGTKKSKRLFKQSMLAPNGNSLAQAEWASNIIGERLVEQRKLMGVSDSSEAWARRRYWKGDFAEALVDATRWTKEEPISWMAYRGASSAAIMLEMYEDAERFVRRGLKHSPESQELLIDLAFLRASQNDLDEAETILNTINIKSDDNKRLIVSANRGLIALRRQQIERGREHYNEAISGFRQRGLFDNEKLARAYFAKEAALANLTDTDKLIKEAEPKRGETLASNASHILKKAKAIFETRGKHQSASQIGSLPGGGRRA